MFTPVSNISIKTEVSLRRNKFIIIIIKKIKYASFWSIYNIEKSH